MNKAASSTQPPPLTPFRQALQQFNSPSINVRRRSGRLNRHFVDRNDSAAKVDLVKPVNSRRRLPTSILAMELCSASDKENDDTDSESEKENMDDGLDTRSVAAKYDQQELNENNAGSEHTVVSTSRWFLLMLVPALISMAAYLLADALYGRDAVAAIEAPSAATKVTSSPALIAEPTAELASSSIFPEAHSIVAFKPIEQYEMYADYALITNGGSILATETSPSYGRVQQPVAEGAGLLDKALRRLGLFLPSSQASSALLLNSPNFVIYPTRSDPYANKCWKMNGNQGQLTIKLARPIIPNNFTLEHVTPALALYGDVSAAPRQVEVYGYIVDQMRYELLGTNEYDIKMGGPQRILADQQRFPTDRVRLKILDNGGNADYTCIYKFRVHGERP